VGPLPVLISGVAMGCIYALVALGYAFIWNAMAIINFAQGEFLMFAAFLYVATFALSLRLGFGLSLLLTAAAMGLLGAVFSRTVYSRLKRQSQIVAIIATVGMGVFLKEAARIIYGPEPFYFPGPLGTRMVPVLGWAIPAQQLVIVGVAVIVMLIQQLLFRHSLAGKVMRAVAEDKETASLMGVPVDTTLALAFAYSTILSAVAGVLLAPLFFITTEMGTMVGIKGFVAMIIGGFGSIPGAILGGVLLGVFENLGTFYISSTYKDAIAFLMMIAFLAWRPQGIYAEPVTERA
jgi:branched-chain amino acid transport system permease protein